MDPRDFDRLHLGDLTRLSMGLTAHEHPALAPDGRYLAYYAGEYGSISIVVCDREGRFARLASPFSGNSTQPAWHPHSRLLVYRHQHSVKDKWELWQTALVGEGAPRKLLAHSEFHYKHPSFDASGRRLAYFSDEGSPGVFHLWLADVVDPQFMRVVDEHAPGQLHEWVAGVGLSARRQVTFANDRMDCHPVFSPDGTRIAYHVYRGTDENAKPAVTNLYELTLATGKIRELSSGDNQFKHPFYLDDSVITFHHEDNVSGVRRLGALHLGTGETNWLSSGDKNDKHPYPWVDPQSGRCWLYYASKREGEEIPGENSSYDIVCAELLLKHVDAARDQGKSSKDKGSDKGRDKGGKDKEGKDKQKKGQGKKRGKK